MSTDSNWQYAIVWEFRVRPGCEGQFEQVYGPEGDWARFFRQGRGYAATQLIRDESDPRRYLTIDFWRSRTDYEAFRQQHAEEYRLIDDKCETMTEREVSLGTFERVQNAG